MNLFLPYVAVEIVYDRFQKLTSSGFFSSGYPLPHPVLKAHKTFEQVTWWRTYNVCNFPSLFSIYGSSQAHKVSRQNDESHAMNESSVTWCQSIVSTRVELDHL